ncbi:MAG: glycosyltransferase family 39 protein [Bacteroidia bacterium]|nr:glycosyltransferase family 39 protein [Bacteroidia bacterium]
MKPGVLFKLFIALYCVAGVATMPDYGVPLDELTQRAIGIENNRIFTSGTLENVQKHGPFGPIFESTAYVLEQLVYSQPMWVKLYLRHGLLFGIFVIAVVGFYSIAKKLFKNNYTSGLITVMFAAYPPLFAHAHYNSKDTLFLSFCIFSLYFLIEFFETKKWKALIAFSILAGISVTLRLSGALWFLVCFSGLWLRREIRPVKALHFTLISISVCAVSFYIFFPWVWSNPIGALVRIFEYSSQNPWPSATLWNSEWISPGASPSMYLPVWLGVSVPLLTIALFFAGTIRICMSSSLRSSAIVWIILTAFWFPVLCIAILKPTLYDGWRHMQFLLVPIFFISGFGLDWIFARYNAIWLPYSIAGYTALVSFFWHPYGYVYFNEAYAAAIRPNSFTQDYWGLSSLQTLKWLAKQDPKPEKKIYSFTESPLLQSQYLKESARAGFHFVQSRDSADYEIELRRQQFFWPTKGKEIFSICPMKDTIIRVIKLQH